MQTFRVTLNLEISAMECDAPALAAILSGANETDMTMRAAAMAAIEITRRLARIIGEERTLRVGQDLRVSRLSHAQADAGPEYVAEWRKTQTPFYGADALSKMLADDAATMAERQAKADTTPVPLGAAAEADRFIAGVFGRKPE